MQGGGHSPLGTGQPLHHGQGHHQQGHTDSRRGGAITASQGEGGSDRHVQRQQPQAEGHPAPGEFLDLFDTKLHSSRDARLRSARESHRRMPSRQSCLSRNRAALRSPRPRAAPTATMPSSMFQPTVNHSSRTARLSRWVRRVSAGLPIIAASVPARRTSGGGSVRPWKRAGKRYREWLDCSFVAEVIT